MKIYTRTGDSGETSLFGGERVSKHSLRVSAYGSVDELNSYLGLCAAYCNDDEIKSWLQSVQNDLFALGAWLASPKACKNIEEGKDPFTGERKDRTHMDDARIKHIEDEIDAWEKELQPMKSFILPGGAKTGAQLHMARAICRRAERDVVGLRESGELVPEYVIRYLNRMADALFVVARVVNHREGIAEIPWK